MNELLKIINSDEETFKNFIIKLNDKNIDEYELIQSDWFIKEIINLDKIGNKLIYLTLLKDEKTLTKWFTSDILLKSLVLNPYRSDLRSWIYVNNFSKELKLKIANKLKELGCIELSMYITRDIFLEKEKVVV